MNDLVAAQKYAHALFTEAQEKNELRACQQGLEEFLRVARLRGRLMEILAHPFIDRTEKWRMIRSTLGEYATPLLERFLALLVEKHRLSLLFAIELKFQEEVDRFHGVQSLKVRTAFPLADSVQKQLQSRLEAWLKSKVRMEVQVDPSLIGGLWVQTRDHVLDGSLKGQLRSIEAQLSH